MERARVFMTTSKTTSTEALFDYQLRVSRRARNVYLRVTAERGLEIVVPRGFDAVHVPTLLKEKERWIRKSLARAETQRALLAPELPWALPETIRLPAIERAWRVLPQPSAGRVTVREQDDCLIVRGRVDDADACRIALTRWLVAQAKIALTPILEALSKRLTLPYRRVSYRLQRSRWGSCSRQRSISLNVKLLFLPPDVMRYVMVHELCHLQEMNHSRRFWALVERHHSGARHCDKALRDGWRLVPYWANRGIREDT
jgi:predicted metal-dependent hydrolase